MHSCGKNTNIVVFILFKEVFGSLRQTSSALELIVRFCQAWFLWQHGHRKVSLWLKKLIKKLLRTNCFNNMVQSAHNFTQGSRPGMSIYTKESKNGFIMSLLEPQLKPNKKVTFFFFVSSRELISSKGKTCFFLFLGWLICSKVSPIYQTLIYKPTTSTSATLIVNVFKNYFAVISG